MRRAGCAGSATHSLESYYNAQTGRYRMLRLTRRAVAQAQLPIIHCIDTGKLSSGMVLVNRFWMRCRGCSEGAESDLH